MKLAHISDCHIRNLKYYDKFKETFDNLFVELEKQKPDIIVFSGDLFHTKSAITGESISLAKYLFSGLTKIAPTHAILGNHDALVKNKERISAVLPIAEEFTNLRLYTKSGFYPVENTNVVFAVYGILDDNVLEFKKEDLEEDKIYIALYHGAVKGSVNKIGFTFLHGDNAGIFEGLDYAFLGDIHEKQQIDDDGRIWYAGSLLQNNHGEGETKGFLLWDIKSKNDWTVNFVEVKSPLKFVTIDLESDGSIPEGISIAEGSQLRLVSKNNLPIDIMKRAIEEAEKRFKPYYVTYFDKGTIEERRETQLLTLGKENLRDSAIQERLIREYLDSFKLNEDIIKRVLDLNKKYSAFAEKEDDIARNVRWELQKIEWSNLFNYGKENSIDFNKLNGTIGIFGKNFTGKTSAIEAIPFTIFNSIAKRSRKNYNIINQTKNWASGKVELLVGREKFTIERRVEKYEKHLKGDITQEAKTELDVNSINLDTGMRTCYNGVSRIDTDKNLRKIFGTVEDFLLISMADQMDALSFVREGSTKRKEILVKFLDLDIFVEKYELAKEDSIKIKNSVKELETVDYNFEIEKQEEKIAKYEVDIVKQKEKCEKEKIKLLDIQKEFYTVKSFIDSAQIKIIDKETIENKIGFTKKTLEEKQKNISLETTAFDEKKDKLQKIEEFFVSDFDIAKCRKEENLLKLKQKLLADKQQEEKIQSSTIGRIHNKIKILKEVPCDENYRECQFIKDAYGAKTILEQEEKQYKSLLQEIKELETEIEELNKKDLPGQIHKYDNLSKTRDKLIVEINTLELETYKKRSYVENLEKELQEQQKELSEYFHNENVIKELKNKQKEKKKLEKEIENTSNIIRDCDSIVVELYKQLGSATHRLSELKEKKEELSIKRSEFAIYDYYLNCMHVNGVVNQIIRNKLPLINEEIQKILANVVKFQIFLELEDNKLEINIKFPKFEPRIMDLGSGAEHHLAAIAIRLALLNVTSLPVSNVFILDEPAIHLDEENLEGFIRILEMIKSYFKCVILITHLDQLKDCADDVITIEKDKNGFSRIKQ
jgi:DNA repair exonuclease SbcCD ATPase subunit/DNA repair exonuclease SbcCD nuclease subunit